MLLCKFSKKTNVIFDGEPVTSVSFDLITPANLLPQSDAAVGRGPTLGKFCN